MPNQPELLKFLNENGPMYVTSCNLSGESPIDIKDASKIFPEVKNIYNFGEGSKDHKPSKIYNLDTKEWIR